MTTAHEATYRSEVLVADEAAVVVLYGELDSVTAARLREDLRELFAAGVRDLTVNLHDCAFVNSSAASVLVDARRRCQDRGGALTLVDPSASARRFLVTSGLVRLFHLEPATPAELSVTTG